MPMCLAPKSHGNSIHRQIIVGRAYTTCGKNVIVGILELPNLIGDEVQVVRNDRNLADINSEIS